MRTRIFSKLTNREAEEYLSQKSSIIVPVGTVEMHGDFPLDCETVVSEAIALKMAEQIDSVILNNLPYFYAGATLAGRGTVQVSIREGIDYLYAVAKSLLRQGFSRQIYISFHGPAHMTLSPMVRDFFDETKTPILYLDLIMAVFKHAAELIPDGNFYDIYVGAYDIMGRLEDVPLMPEKKEEEKKESSVKAFQDLFSRAYQSAAVGYYFGEKSDHAQTPVIRTAEERQLMADRGREIIDRLVEKLDVPSVMSQLDDLDAFQNNSVFAKYGEWL
ncbi:creatininase family protein [Proteiniclasticum sp. SCR006]|uniref:Creatininase family protein n=1 Tax=Proteiniclasticum aestuarii TaxID=2817862 RepID=A0A939KJY8_9CLOT|nr:creatininase family protein [Proteiniclasticum aestuarii]MBO1264180.1 creatininase family protein [Proteiniclasticum aestuarii]